MNAYPEVQDSGNDWSPPRHEMLYRSVQKFSESPKPQAYGIIFHGLEKQMATLAVEHEAGLKEVRKLFVMPTDSSVTTFLTEHRSVLQTLVEAAGHLKQCFGAETVFRLRTTVDEAGSRTLYAAVMWPGKVGDVRAALAKFDDWWLTRSHPGAGFLTFTYELV